MQNLKEAKVHQFRNEKQLSGCNRYRAETIYKNFLKKLVLNKIVLDFQIVILIRLNVHEPIDWQSRMSFKDYFLK